ncbi:hypothetical protein AGMMS49938_12950 [Fibrobacterales bacterium]|nr:hypothetical protein AGMMS49938_12950 [Fibrobacterales bacterium]
MKWEWGKEIVEAGFNKYICPIKKKPEIICIYNGRKPALEGKAEMGMMDVGVAFMPTFHRGDPAWSPAILQW